MCNISIKFPVNAITPDTIPAVRVFHSLGISAPRIIESNPLRPPILIPDSGDLCLVSGFTKCKLLFPARDERLVNTRGQLKTRWRQLKLTWDDRNPPRAINSSHWETLDSGMRLSSYIFSRGYECSKKSCLPLSSRGLSNFLQKHDPLSFSSSVVSSTTSHSANESMMV